MRRRVGWLMLAAALGGLGCHTAGAPPPAARRDAPGLHLELIEKLLDSGRPRAALAHLEALEADAAARPDAQLLRAETLRRLGRPEEARALYATLLDTESAALAQRGLGLLAARDGDLAGAVARLRRARELRPTSDRIRNDLGYALILSGELDGAREELVTALELGAGSRAVRNLLLLLLLEGRTGEAESFAVEHAIAPRTVSRLWRHAESLRGLETKGDAR